MSECETCEVFDDEYWRTIHYGRAWTDSHDEAEGSESSLSNDSMLRCSNLSFELRQMMVETNELLRARGSRLDHEWEDAQVRGDQNSMEHIANQIRETHGLMYSGLDEACKVLERCKEFLR